MVIVQHFPGSAKQYIAAFASSDRVFALPERCPHPACQAVNALIFWGTYERRARTTLCVYIILIQRVRCKACGRTHSLLPDFVHPYRHYIIGVLQRVVASYLLAGLGLVRLMDQLVGAGPARSTVREWIDAFAHGAGELLLDLLVRRLLALDPLAELSDPAPPQHLNRVPNPTKQRRLARAHRFWLLAEHLYAQVKAQQVRLHFAPDHLFSFLLHWLQSQALPPRLFWSPALSTGPHTPL
jgi:hypothetical protein